MGRARRRGSRGAPTVVFRIDLHVPSRSVQLGAQLTMPPKPDVIIIGAGPAGLACAATMGAAGLSANVTVDVRSGSARRAQP